MINKMAAITPNTMARMSLPAPAMLTGETRGIGGNLTVTVAADCRGGSPLSETVTANT